MLRLVITVAFLAVSARADLDINCTFSDAVGTWQISETERIGYPDLDCSELGDIVYKKTFTLEYPNIVTDELGNEGTWTLIYNQGFEVNINGRSYWSPFHYTATGYSCDRLFNGWSRDFTVRNWACYTGVKAGKEDSWELKPFPEAAFEAEDGSRMFKNDLSLIERINAAQSSWRAKAYPEHEKYTVQQMMRRSGSSRAQLPPTAPATQEQKMAVSMLPESFDWRDVDGVSFVSPVRDQRSCGSCYAFASAGLLEARIRIATQNERQDVFSPQDPVSCTKLDEGCNGGFSYLIAGRYGMDQGWVAEDCNPYTGTDGRCETNSTCHRTYTDHYEYVGGYYGACNEELMLQYLMERGPLAVDMMVHGDFQAYSGGIYHHVQLPATDFNPLYIVNHVVMVVGYGADETTGEKYWIGKNSWGSSWGEDGFFRIRRGTNEVGFESAAVDVTIIP